MTHYVGMSGFRGCRPRYAEVRDTYDAVVAVLAEKYNLEADRVEVLSINGVTELDVEIHGDEYVQILECECDASGRHT